MARNASYDKNKDYYQILGISETANTGDVLRAYNAKVDALKEALRNNTISGEDYQEQLALASEAADVLSNGPVRTKYDNARREMAQRNNRTRVTNQEEAPETAKKGWGCLIPLAAAGLAFVIFVSTFGAHLAYEAMKRDGYLKGDSKNESGYEQIIDDEDKDKNQDQSQTQQNDYKQAYDLGNASDMKQVAERAEEIQSQLGTLNVINQNTGVPYTDAEITAIIQFINGAYLPKTDAEAFVMVDNTLNFVTSIINTPKTLNMVQYQGNSDVITRDMVEADAKTAPFKFSSLVMGQSNGYDVILLLDDAYEALATTTDKDQFKKVHNKTYQALANLMYGDGLVINGKTYTIKDFEGLGNQGEGNVLNMLMYIIPVYHVEGIQKSFNVHYSQAGDVVVSIDKIDEQFNALCGAKDYKYDDNGLVYYDGVSNFSTVNQTNTINAALQNYQLGNTDAYNHANGYHTKK